MPQRCLFRSQLNIAFSDPSPFPGRVVEAVNQQIDVLSILHIVFEPISGNESRSSVLQMLFETTNRKRKTLLSSNPYMEPTSVK
ncbi:hypothetical protein [Salibacterium aidingense]|uniref:hypothetical protein n=1 Tax=Salibacterium aidingense TaxID=384933 RepID=UPI003BED67A4